MIGEWPASRWRGDDEPCGRDGGASMRRKLSFPGLLTPDKAEKHGSGSLGTAEPSGPAGNLQIWSSGRSGSATDGIPALVVAPEQQEKSPSVGPQSPQLVRRSLPAHPTAGAAPGDRCERPRGRGPPGGSPDGRTGPYRRPTGPYRGVRDRALLLVGFAGAFRRSELVALDVVDVEHCDDGPGDQRTAVQDRPGRRRAQGGHPSFGSHPTTCPVRPRSLSPQFGAADVGPRPRSWGAW